MGFFENIHVAQARVSACLNHMQGMQKLARSVLDAWGRETGSTLEFEIQFSDMDSCPVQSSMHLVNQVDCGALPRQAFARHYPQTTGLYGKMALRTPRESPFLDRPLGSQKVSGTAGRCLREDREPAVRLISRDFGHPSRTEESNRHCHAAVCGDVPVGQNASFCATEPQRAPVHAGGTRTRDVGVLPHIHLPGASESHTHSDAKPMAVLEGTGSQAAADAVSLAPRTQASFSRTMPVQQQPRRAAEPALESLARLPSESVEPAVAVQVSLRTDPPCVHSSPRARKTVTALDPGQAVRKVLKEEAHESMERWSIVHDREPGRLSTASFPSVTGRYSNLSTLHASDGSGTGARRRSKQDGTRNYEVTMLTAWQFFKELHEVVLETGDLRDYICHTYGVRRRQESGLSCAKRSRGVCKQRRHGRVLTPACERVDYTLSGASLPTSTTSSVRCTASLASSSVSTTAMAAPTRATPASVSTNSYQMDPRRPEGRSIAPAGLGHAVRREERALVDMLLARTFSQIDETEGLDTEGSFAASPSSSDFSDSLCFLDAVLDALVEDSSEEVYVS